MRVSQRQTPNRFLAVILPIALVAVFALPQVVLALYPTYSERGPTQIPTWSGEETGWLTAAGDVPSSPTTPDLSKSQEKIGSLMVGERNGVLPNCTNADSSGCSKLCLNAETSLGVTDPSNCIMTWSDVTAMGANAYLHLQKVTEVTPDSGYVDLAALPQSNYPIVPGEEIPLPPSKTGRSTLSMISLIANASGKPGNAGLSAASLSDTQDAGHFVGTFDIEQNSEATALCLNGDCRKSWAETVSNPNLLHLQKTRTYTPDQGSVSASGPIVISGSMIVGLPSANTTLPSSLTCGDGLCTPDNGEIISCSIDCVYR